MSIQIIIFIIILLILLLFLLSIKKCSYGYIKYWFKCIYKCKNGQFLNNNICSSSCESGKRIGKVCLAVGENCPSNLPYLNGNECVSKCESGKRIGNVCLAVGENCPSSLPYLNQNECVSSCESGKRIGNVCLAVGECPNTHPYTQGDECFSSCESGKRIGKVCLAVGENCPPNLPYLNRDECVSSCESGKRIRKVCLAVGENCPLNYPLLIEDECLPCIENPNQNFTINDNGNCVNECIDSTRPFFENGFFEGRMYKGGNCTSTCVSGKRDGNICVENCPTWAPYLNKDQCESSCPSGKRDGNICVENCPNNKPVLINGVCYSIPYKIYNSIISYYPGPDGNYSKSNDISSDTYWEPIGQNTYTLITIGTINPKDIRKLFVKFRSGPNLVDNQNTNIEIFSGGYNSQNKIFNISVPRNNQLVDTSYDFDPIQDNLITIKFTPGIKELYDIKVAGL
jgi:hypothetical protein